MIDWWGLLHNALWVAGLAIILGALSMASYEAQRAHVHLRHKLQDPGFRLWSSVGAALFCTGLVLGGEAWWEYVLWGLLALASVAKGLRASR
ncbi:MAG: hypothetical protein PVI59_17955 [Anaerolineae bacterium]|jgi:hypothetical protein